VSTWHFSRLQEDPIIRTLLSGYQRRETKKRTFVPLLRDADGSIIRVRVSDAHSTLELLALAKRGDQKALESLFARYARPLRRWAHGRLPKWARDVSDTPDLVQDVLLETFKRIEHFEPRSEVALQAYLRQAVMNRVRDELRRHRRRPGTVELDSRHVDDGPSPLETAVGEETIERYDEALQRLQESERDLIVGRVELGLSYEELADLLDKPSPEAARKAAQRALVRLAEEMKHVR
jgi:RNA polymerase sigma-70 factor (ECF subfamily)